MIRDWIFRWLRLPEHLSITDKRVDKWAERLVDLELLVHAQAAKIEQLERRSRAFEIPVMPMYQDYETAQIHVLKEFKEK